MLIHSNGVEECTDFLDDKASAKEDLGCFLPSPAGGGVQSHLGEGQQGRMIWGIQDLKDLCWKEVFKRRCLKRLLAQALSPWVGYTKSGRGLMIEKIPVSQLRKSMSPLHCSRCSLCWKMGIHPYQINRYRRIWFRPHALFEFSYGAPLGLPPRVGKTVSLLVG